MQQPMTIACLQLNSGNAVQQNMQQIEALAQQACGQGAQLIALPENAYYMRGNDDDAPHHFTMETHPGVQHAQGLAQRLNVWLLVGSVFVAMGEKWANRSLLITPNGDITATYDKIHLFDVDFGDGETYLESRWFAGGDTAKLAALPCGVLGMSICYDLRFPKLYRALAHAGATILSIPAAFTYRTGMAHWHTLLRARAIENGCYVIAPAQCGHHPGKRRTYGHALIIDPWGEILAEDSEDTPGIITATIDPARVEAIRQQLPTLKHEKAFKLQNADY